MADNARLICALTDLEDKGRAVRFDLPELGERVTGFVVRWEGISYAYVNRCAHVPVELDWQEGEFFDADQRHLICATHGAHYLPENGRCIMGPCRGGRLEPLAIAERDGNIYLILED